MRLNKDLDEVRGRVLGTKPLPNVREAFSEVRLEESHRKVIMGSSSSSSTGEGSALAVCGSQQPLNNDNRPRKGQTWCNHCHKPGHTIPRTLARRSMENQQIGNLHIFPMTKRAADSLLLPRTTPLLQNQTCSAKNK